MRAENLLFEIRTVPTSNFTGGKKYLIGKLVDKPLKPLSGSNGLAYFVTLTSHGTTVINVADTTKTADRPEKTPWDLNYPEKLLAWHQNKGKGLVIAEMVLSDADVQDSKILIVLISSQ